MWQEVRKNSVWILTDFFSSGTMACLDSLKSDVSRSKEMSSKVVPIISDTFFHYHYVKGNFSTGNRITDEIQERLNQLLFSIDGSVIPKPPWYTSQSMIKFFTAGSQYELHTESQRSFGPWVFVVYLTNEEMSPLQFLSTTGVQLKVSGEELIKWRSMELFLRANNQSIYYVEEDLEILPKRNLGVVFRTGTVHRIPPYKSPFPGRFCVTGWPFAAID